MPEPTVRTPTPEQFRELLQHMSAPPWASDGDVEIDLKQKHPNGIERQFLHKPKEDTAKCVDLDVLDIIEEYNQTI